ncbi:hypothetical protein [Halomonas sp. DWK9]|uniref:hypothetical protein n=1 Tax=Halomonas sp. DWK9 TaxID=3060155 RepID=UPI00287F5AF0|nr:hypothetical protein [Halomonas sp. DWK9]
MQIRLFDGGLSSRLSDGQAAATTETMGCCGLLVCFFGTHVCAFSIMCLWLIERNRDSALKAIPANREAQLACLLLDFVNPHLHARFYDILMRFFYLRWDNP